MDSDLLYNISAGLPPRASSSSWITTTTGSLTSFSTLLASLPWSILLPILAITYLTLVQVLRFRALHALEAKYAAYLADPYRLTYQQAHDILKLTFLQEYPFLFAFGTQWALLKSYAIAKGTPLLVQTRQLADPCKAGRRAEDTSVFLSELLGGDIDSPRGRLCMSKLNWLHGQYPSIREDDFVHTLTLFVLEPQAWIARWGWRPMTRLEKVAHLIYWRELGHRMGFGGIPDTLEGMAKWREEYHAKEMYFAPTNKIVTEATMEVFVQKLPMRLRGVVKRILPAFIEEPEIRAALGMAEPPMWAVMLTRTVLGVQKAVVRHLCLPRMRPLDVLAKPGPDGRLYRSPRFMAFEPWYVADTWYNRVAVWLKSWGKMCPGGEFQSRGYLPEELGPAGFTKICQDSVREQAKAMEEYVNQGGSAVVGCPFRFGN